MTDSRLIPPQFAADRAQLTHDDAQVADGGGQWTELHRRDVILRGGDYYAVCSCGFISTSRPTVYAAFSTECEVEAILAISAERRRRLYDER